MMERDLSSRDSMQGNVSFVGFDLQDPIRLHHHQKQQFLGSSSTVHKNFPVLMGVHDLNKARSGSDEDEPSFADEIPNSRKGKKASSSASQWHRVKWTDEMVRLLITAVSYINEEASVENSNIGSRRKSTNLQKKGKWKSVSNVLAERGFFVSPQQCEDKFNDLNKRYKRLNEILGRGTCCEVVENPSLLDMIDHVSEKGKDEVRKILSSKHLHYEEMCSYHNGNRLHLPPDPELHRSLLLALGSRDDHEEHDNDTEFDHETEYDDHEDDSDEAGLRNHSKRSRPAPQSLDCNRIGDHDFDLEVTETNPMSKKQWISRRSVQLEEQRLHIETQMLEIEKERFKWQRFCRKKSRELEVARIEMERMKLANERMMLELRKKEMELNES